MDPNDFERANCSACQNGDSSNHDQGHPNATSPPRPTQGGKN